MSNWLQQPSPQNNNQIQSIDQFRRSKQDFQQSQKKIMETIQRNTQQEVKQVEQAINNLNQKVDLIMKTPEMKQEQTKMKQSKKLMFLSLQTALKAFQEGESAIQQRTDLSEAQKNHYIKELHQKLLEKLYTPDEINQFKQMLANTVVIMPKQITGPGQRPGVFTNTMPTRPSLPGNTI